MPQPGMWILRLNPEAVLANLQDLATLLSRELTAGGVLTDVDPIALDSLSSGTFPPAGLEFRVHVSGEPHLHFHIAFLKALSRTAAVDSVLGPRGAPESFCEKEIQTLERWLTSDIPSAMLIGRWQTVSPRKRRLFGCACCRHALDSLTEERSRRAILISEAFADGVVGEAELKEAHDAAKAWAWEVANSGHKDESLCYFGVASAAYPGNASIAASNAFVEAAEGELAKSATRLLHANLLRDIVGNPFNPVVADSSWLTPTVVLIAQAAYDNRTFPEGTLATDRLAILSDALEDTGCTDTAILEHLRGPGPHVRGCFAVDCLLGKE
jgi:hypothetical protein